MERKEFPWIEWIGGKHLVGILTFILRRSVYKRGGVRWNVRSAFVECVLSRSSNASGMKKKNVIHIGCLVETNVAWSRFECDVKRQITINTRRTCLYMCLHTGTCSICVYLSSTSCFREENNTDIVYSRIQFLEQFPTIYTTRSWLNLERSSLELSNGHMNCRFPEKFIIKHWYLFIFANN